MIGGLDYGSGAGLCNKTIDKTNGTGIVSFNPAFLTAEGPSGQFSLNAEWPIPDASWLVTVNKVLGELYDVHYWFDTAGHDYFNDEKTLFDACGIILAPNLPVNTLRLGQDDPGDCSAMLTQDCREALKTQVADAAANWIRYASPPPYSNLTAGDMQWGCRYIADALAWKPTGDNAFYFPQECAQDFGYGEPQSSLSVIPVALTGNNQSQPANYHEALKLNADCPVLGAGGTKYYNTGFGWSTGDYQGQMHTPTPVLTVYFAVANEAAQPRTNINPPYATSQLRCLRVTNVSADSQALTRLPAGTPYPSSGISIPTDDLIGIVVGCVLFVILIALLTARWWWQRRRRRAQHAAEQSKLEDKIERSDEAIELERGDKYELTPKDRKPEIDGGAILEVGNMQVPEMGNSRAGSTHGAVELDGGGRWSFNSSRASLSSYNTAGS